VEFIYGSLAVMSLIQRGKVWKCNVPWHLTAWQSQLRPSMLRKSRHSTPLFCKQTTTDIMSFMQTCHETSLYRHRILSWIHSLRMVFDINSKLSPPFCNKQSELNDKISNENSVSTVECRSRRSAAVLGSRHSAVRHCSRQSAVALGGCMQWRIL